LLQFQLEKKVAFKAKIFGSLSSARTAVSDLSEKLNLPLSPLPFLCSVNYNN
jgi:hypothetical protein